MPKCGSHHCVFVIGGSGLDRIQMNIRGEKHVVDPRMVDQIQHIGGVTPDRGPRSDREFRTQLMPRQAAVLMVALRVSRPQAGGDGLLDQVVDHQAVASAVYKGERLQPIIGIVGRDLRQHRLQ